MNDTKLSEIATMANGNGHQVAYGWGGEGKGVEGVVNLKAR